MTGHKPGQVFLDLMKDRDRLKIINADLLAALKELLELAEGEFVDFLDDPDHIYAKPIYAARAAIAKAEGKTDD